MTAAGILRAPMSGRFEGWYYKHQSLEGKSLAVIPGKADGGAFVLVISDNKSYHVSYPLSEYRVSESHVRVGGNVFSREGVSLDIHAAEISLRGEISYGNLAPIRGDIMGPFRFFPMECSHGVISMNHELCGEVVLDGETLNFGGGRGYIESDSGRSFPSAYTWVHCNAFAENCSIMASVARIPFYGLRFWGCICVVWLDGREYRLATYKGVRILRCERGAIELAQGRYRLRVFVDDGGGQRLPAPRRGEMSRFIRETLACPARFRFTDGDTVLFEGESNHASYECMME